MRCFVIGDVLSGTTSTLQAVHRAEEHYDAIVIRGSVDESRACSELAQIIKRCSNPAAPIIASVARFGAMADFDLPSDSEYAISAALFLAQPLIKRIAALPRIPLGADRDRLLALTIAHTRDTRLDAIWSPNDPSLVRYPKLAGISNPRAVLEQLAEQSLVRGRYFDQLFVCARCESSRLAAREVCVACRSSDIIKQPLLHHYGCGFQAPQSRFEKPDGFVCPKCAKQLRHYGVDYDRPGVTYECRACKDTMSEPEVDFVCADCSHVQASDGAARKVWSHYDILPDGVAAVRAGALPATEGASSEAARSLRDFRLIARHMMTLSARAGRSVTCFKMQIGGRIFETEEGPALMEGARGFTKEIAKQCLAEGDIVAVVEDGLVACLPDATEDDAKRATERIETEVHDKVQGAVAVQFKFYKNEAIATLLERL